MYASEGRWKRAAHLALLGRLLVKVANGDIKRLAVSMPPRHGKSELISKYFPTWFIGAHRGRVMLTSYGQSLTRQWSQAGRDLFHSHAPDVFGLTTWPRASWTSWPIMEGGKPIESEFYAVGRGGVMTGRGADLLIIDDPIKDGLEANSPTVREHIQDWLRRVPLTRLEPGGRCVLVMTRWHHDDVVGQLMAEQAAGTGGEPWTFVNLPAICDEDNEIERELGRKPGDALWPERWPAEWARKKEQEVGPAAWSSLYQGRPTPLGGGLFARKFFGYFVEDAGTLTGPSTTTARANLAIYATIDLAFSTKTSADYTAVCIFGADIRRKMLYLLHVARERVGTENLAHWIRRLFDEHHVRRGYVERSGFHADITSYLRTVAKLPLAEIQPNTDKLSRAQPAAALIASGGLLFRSAAPWLHKFESELLEFPSGAHDDQVDALSAGVHVFNSLGGPQPPSTSYKPRPDPDQWRIGR